MLISLIIWQFFITETEKHPRASKTQRGVLNFRFVIFILF